MTTPKLALVTGASAGIGEALAREIAQDGYSLLLVARREDRLEALKSTLPGPGTHRTLALDVTAPGALDTLEAAVADIGAGAVDLLVNNAGFGRSGPFLEAPREAQLGMVDLNIRALVDLTHRFLPGMVAAGSGGVLNVASTAAYQPGPYMAVYYASKAFVLSFSEALWEECRGTGVTISALCPGPTHSEFGAIAGMEKNRIFRYAKRMTSEEVARQGWAGHKKRRRVTVTGAQNKFTAAAGRVAPRAMLLPIVKRLQSD